MFGATRRLSLFAAGAQNQRKLNGLLAVAGAAVAVAGLSTQPPKEPHQKTSRTARCDHRRCLFQGLTLPYLSSRTFCESAVLSDHGEEKPTNDEEERFLDTIALYRRWFGDIKKQWDISKPASTTWPTNIPQERDISALEIDLQLYLNGDQANTRRRQDLQFRIASYYLFREKSIAQQKKGFKMIRELAVDGHPDGLCLYGKSEAIRYDLLASNEPICGSFFHWFFDMHSHDMEPWKRCRHRGKATFGGQGKQALLRDRLLFLFLWAR
jgi:hypothetical protein